jgi:hypothetical protein
MTLAILNQYYSALIVCLFIYTGSRVLFRRFATYRLQVSVITVLLSIVDYISQLLLLVVFTSIIINNILLVDT